MTRDPHSGVELLGDALPYADGAEDEIGAVLASVAVADRGSSSDALAARIHDWPTRYHLSRLRSNLLRPLAIRPGARVLDVGAGTGALARYLGEQGAHVTALEGSLSRARAAASRCEGLDDVRVVCGSIGDLHDDPFDVVLVVGVLEYAAHAFGGGLGPHSFLADVRRLTADDGVTVLAIENQLGLKYLLGYAEDHLGEPWAGVEHYRSPGGRGIRTYSRRTLTGLLDAAGLTPRRWLYPYPDYKLPTVVLADRCFAEHDAAELFDQLVRTPVVDHAHPRTRLCDDRAASAAFVEAGLGEDVANSFLVVAGHEAAAAGLVDDDVLAWHFGTERLSMWLRSKTVRSTADGRRVEAVPRLDVSRQRAWLTQEIAANEPYVNGPTLERLAVDAIAGHDVDALAKLLAEWHQHLAGTATAPSDEVLRDPPNPFLRRTTMHVLPADHVDVDLANFVREGDGDGALRYVDREWSALGGVDLELAVTRALWAFAHRTIVSGTEMPWSPAITVDELTVTLGSLFGFTIGSGLLADWRTAEDWLQELVIGLPRDAGTDHRVSDGGVCRASLPTAAGIPFTTLRRDLVRARAEIDALHAAEAGVTARADAAERQLAAAHAELARLAEQRAADGAEMARVHAEVARLSGEVNGLYSTLATAQGELDAHRARVARFERRLLVRLYRRVRPR